MASDGLQGAEAVAEAPDRPLEAERPDDDPFTASHSSLGFGKRRDVVTAVLSSYLLTCRPLTPG